MSCHVGCDVTSRRAVLQRDGHVPLYVQIRDLLVADIEAGDPGRADQPPSEPELVARSRCGPPAARARETKGGPGPPAALCRSR